MSNHKNKEQKNLTIHSTLTPHSRFVSRMAYGHLSMISSVIFPLPTTVKFFAPFVLEFAKK